MEHGDAGLGRGPGAGDEHSGSGGTGTDVEPSPFITPEQEPVDDPPVVIDEACLEVDAELDETLLVVVLDVGASMGSNRDPSASRALKWTPVAAGLEAFVTSTAAVGTKAALTFFPKPAGSDPGANNTDAGIALSCDESDYASFDVPFTSLPTDALRETIGSSVPEGDEGWLPGAPMLAALGGSYGATLAALEGGPVRKATVVLITDGAPEGCTTDANDVAAVVESIAEVAETIQTAVVVIDDPVTEETPEPANDASALGELAEAGGLGGSHRIDTTNATVTAATLEAVLHDIRMQATRCEIAVPEPPEGTPLEPDRLNVQLSDGIEEIPLPYDANCESAEPAWRFDDVEAPGKVVLCPDSCASFAASLYRGSLDIRLSFGCPRREVSP